MPNTRRNFIKGRMNLDVDERLLQDGEYREAENIEVINSEGSDVGAIENSLSNRKLTNLDLGNNVIEIGKFEDESEDKIYWFTKSDLGCFLLEWDDINQLASIVLKDTRTEDVDRVLNLKETHLITGIQKVISEDTNSDLLVWTDDNIEPCCINIERAKTWEKNGFGFEEEDIYLIKKPPRYALKATPAHTSDGSNNLEDKFPSFFYRYKYRDGEYSALSDPTNYKFSPKPFQLDYFTLENTGMVNSFNAVRLEYNTGPRQVTDIQLCVKFSGSITIYVIESFNKATKGLRDNITSSYIFSNSKIYRALPEKELYRSFDNIPSKAKSLALIENIIVLGNYEEGMNIEDSKDKSIDVSYSLSLINSPIESATDFTVEVRGNKLFFTNTGSELLEVGKQLFFSFNINIETTLSYSNSFLFTIEKEYSNLNELVRSVEFNDFVSIINSDYTLNYNNSGDYEINPDYALNIDTSLTVSIEGGKPTFTLSPILFRDTANSNAGITVRVNFGLNNFVGIQYSDASSSCKSNMVYEAGIEYIDKYGRKTPVLTSSNSTLFIPQAYSVFKNKLRLSINSPAPKGADRYKICIKAKPLQYQNIYVNEFYTEGNFVWAKLVGENRDKVKVGDSLLVKKAGSDYVSNPITVKVLDVEPKSKNFIEDNKDKDDNDIIETEGVYMKIRPSGFSMDLDDFATHQKIAPTTQSSNTPSTSLDLFTEIKGSSITELKINQGSYIYLNFSSQRDYDSGRHYSVFERTFSTLREYIDLEDWFNEVLKDKSIPAIETVNGSPNGNTNDYKNNISIERFNNKLYMVVKGLYSGGTRGRYGRVSAEIIVRNSSGFYAFETIPKQIETETYYQTEQCFDVVNGNHNGTNGNHQDYDAFIPAVVDLGFFNCYAQGNGVESYKYKDGFNSNHLNIDLRPSSTTIERPSKIRRFADLIYSQPFVESSGLNGLNEFNASTANFKELDKQYGSIQRLASRDTDLVVWQEDKVSKVLFGKDLLSMANGETALSTTPDILGQQVPYAGENGIGKNPESLAQDAYRFYYTNSRRGTPIRLSMDGTTEINNGTIAYFRELFIKNPRSIKVGGYDPYHQKYVLSSSSEDSKIFNSYCGNSISKKISSPFTYILNLNYLLGETVLNYNIKNGNATIEAVYDNVVYVASNVTGLGNLNVPRTDITKDKITVTITPVNSTVDVEVTNNCPIGVSMNLYSLVLNSESYLTKTIINRYRHGGSSFYADNHYFQAFEVSKFTKETGIEGIGKFPERGKTVNIQSYKDDSSTATYDALKGMRLGYLVSENEHTEADIETILTEATFLTVAETQVGVNSFINQGEFVFNRLTDTENLYLIWDYKIKNLPPVASNDTYTLDQGGFLELPVINNDSDPENEPLTVIITQQPLYGTVLVNPNNTITYTHNDSINTTDSFKYKVNDGVFDSNIATVNLTITLAIPVAANDSFTVQNGEAITINILSNDTDYNGFPLTINQIISNPTNGTLTINPDNTVTYVHSGNNVLTDAFTYNVTNGIAVSNVASVNINILEINEQTKIYIYFDSSGSMNSTLTPLNTMKDTLLKDRLLPFYNNDSALYDASVSIISQTNERTLDMLNMNGNTPIGNVVVLVFQDEAENVYHETAITPRTTQYELDISTILGRLDGFPQNYYRGVIFQVTGNITFKSFVQAIQNGTGDYGLHYGLSLRNEFNYKYDVTNGGTPQYYLDMILIAMNELGYDI